jgi:hypothetical protein
MSSQAQTEGPDAIMRRPGDRGPKVAAAMSTDVWIGGNTLSYLEGAGQLWIHLNWALSLVDAGCRVTWVELAETPEIEANGPALRQRLEQFGLGDALRVIVPDDRAPDPRYTVPLASLDELAEADVLLNFCYWLPKPWVGTARRSALVDIDPGLLQIWISEGDMVVAPHDHWFTIGETVGTPDARFPDCGLTWRYTPPPVHLASWPVGGPPAGDAYTTVTHWWEGWMSFQGEEYPNDKRTSFLEFVDVPRLSGVPLELATYLDDDDDQVLLEGKGWRLHDSASVRTPDDYRDYVRRSRGEFSCAKPSCMRLQNAWVSDRTICYLASGRPAIVQHTGPSRALDREHGILRFHTPEEAASALRKVEADYDAHASAARAVAEETFDGVQVVSAVLDRCG